MIINPLIHGLSIAARLFMVLALAAKIPEQDVAQVGLIMTTVIWIVMFFDYENGTDVGRRIATATSRSEQEEIFRVYCSYSSARLVIAIFCFAISILLGSELIALVCVIATSETIIFSSRKLLLGLGLLRASMLFEFMRAGPWAAIFSFIVFFEIVEYHLLGLLLLWTFSSVIAFIVLMLYLNKIFPRLIFQRPNFCGFINIIRSNSALFISSFYLIFVETFPRYMLGINGMGEQLAVYVFFSGFIFSIPIFMWIVSIGQNYRALAAFHSSKGEFSFLATICFYRKILLTGLLTYLIISAISYISLCFLVENLVKGVYQNYLSLLPLLLILPLIIFLDSIATNALAIKGRDLPNLSCAIIAIILMLSVLLVQGKDFDIWEVPSLLGATYFVSAMLRFFFLWRLSGPNRNSRFI